MEPKPRRALLAACSSAALFTFACRTTLTGADIPEPALAQQQVRVHIDADASVGLWRNIGLTGYEVCKSPCDTLVPVDPKDFFTLEGDFPTPPSFQLDGRGPDVRVDVNTGSLAAEAVGAIGILLGSTAVVTTTFTTAVFFALDAGEGAAFSTEVTAALVGAHLAGVVCLAIGIPLLVLSPTKARVSPDPKKSTLVNPFAIRFQ